jgi:hypothetical protein
MPTETRPLVTGVCEPTISVFDPPSYVVASLREVIASFEGTRPRNHASLDETRPRVADVDRCGPSGHGAKRFASDANDAANDAQDPIN